MVCNFGQCGHNYTIIAHAVDDASAVFTHMVSYVEARAALAKACRMQRMSDKDHTVCKAALDHDWDQLEVITLDMTLIKQAGNLAETYGLCGYDSMHLAAAERVSRQSKAFTFACFDKDLNRAALSLGLETLNCLNHS